MKAGRRTPRSSSGVVSWAAAHRLAVAQDRVQDEADGLGDGPAQEHEHADDGRRRGAHRQPVPGADCLQARKDENFDQEQGEVSRSRLRLWSRCKHHHENHPH